MFKICHKVINKAFPEVNISKKKCGQFKIYNIKHKGVGKKT